MANVAFIGLGNMGGPMAKNLLSAGHQVCVFDLVPEACQQLADAGATVAASAAEALDGVEYVVSMLAATSAPVQLPMVVKNERPSAVAATSQP